MEEANQYGQIEFTIRKVVKATVVLKAMPVKGKKKRVVENNDETLAIFEKIKAKLFVRKKRDDEAQKLEKLFLEDT